MTQAVNVAQSENGQSRYFPTNEVSPDMKMKGVVLTDAKVPVMQMQKWI